MNIGTIIVGSIIMLMVVFIIKKMVRDKKQGHSSCCGDCSRCGGGCH